MLTIQVPIMEQYDSVKGEFIYPDPVTLRLEHSLVAISKWESKWKKPFLMDGDKSDVETYDYIRCMSLDDDIDESILKSISQEGILKITEYIKSPMTATTVNSSGDKNREIVTSELVYYWMIGFNIPFECQTWHLNRLLTLINVCSAKNAPPKKTNKKDMMSRNASLNAARKKAMCTSG